MKLNPPQAPLYGESLLTVQLSDDECPEDEEEMAFYLLFAGSAQRHLCSTLRVSRATLQAVSPAHDCCEPVQVTLCWASPGRPAEPVGEATFCFVQDLAYDMAQFLVSAAGQPEGLEGALLLDERHIPVQECERLDASLALALGHLKLPEGWSLLGIPVDREAEPPPQETLLHFAARRGLLKVACFLLQQPGGCEALSVENKQGITPLRIVQDRGHTQLERLFTQQSVLPRDRQSGKVLPGSRVVRHHPRLNTYTLTVGAGPGPPNLQQEVEELRGIISRRQSQEGTSLLLQPGRASSEELAADQLAFCAPDPSPALCAVAARAQDIPAGPGSASDSSTSSLNNGEAEDGACPWRNAAVDCGEQEDKGAGLQPEQTSDSSQAAEEGEGAAFDTSFLGRGAGEAVLVCGAISAGSGSSEKQEVESAAEGVAEAPGHDNAFADMGHSQSQEGCSEADTENQRSWGLIEQNIGETARGGDAKDTVQEKKVGTETGDGEAVDVDGTTVGSLRICEESESTAKMSDGARPTAVESDLSEAVLKADTGDCEQSQEAAAVDCVERDGDAGNDSNSGQVAETEQKQSDCNVLDPTETGNPNERTQNGGSLCPSTMTSLPETVKEGSGQPHKQVDRTDKTCSVLDMAAQVGEMSSGNVKFHFEGEPSGSKGEPLPQYTECTASKMEEFSHEPGVTCTVEVAAFSEVGPAAAREEEPSTVSDNACEGESATGGEEFLLKKEEPAIPETDAAIDTPVFETEALLHSVDTVSNVDHNGCCDAPKPTEEQPSFIRSDITDFSLLDICPHPTVDESDVEPLVGVELVTFALHGNDKGAGCSTDEGQQMEAPTDLFCAQDVDIQEVVGASINEDHLSSLQLTGENREHNDSPEALSIVEEVSECRDNTMDSFVTSSPLEAHVDHMETETRESLREPESAENGSSSSTEILGKEVPTHSLEEAREDLCHSQQKDCIRSTQNCLESELTFDTGFIFGSIARSTNLPVLEEEPTEGIGKVICSASEGSVKEKLDLSQTECSADATSLESGSDVTPTGLSVVEEETEVNKVALNFVIPETDEGLSSMDSCKSAEVTEVSEESSLVDRGTEIGSEASAGIEGGQEGPCIKEAAEDAGGDVVEGKVDLTSEKETPEEIHREKATFCAISPCTDAEDLGRKRSSECSESPESLTPQSAASSVSSPQRDSPSDVDVPLGTDAEEDSVFRKGGGKATPKGVGEASASCSSVNDAAGAGGAAEEEEKDRVAEVPKRSALLRSSVRSLSPFRRHSWGPGKNAGGEAEIGQRCSVPAVREGKPSLHRRSMSWCPSDLSCPGLDEIGGRSYSLEGLAADEDPRKELLPQGASSRNPQAIPRLNSDERGSLVSLTEEEHESDLGDCSSLDSQNSVGLRSVRHSFPIMTKSVSMLAIGPKDMDVTRLSSSTSGSTAYSISEEDPGPLRNYTEGKSSTKVSRTFSYLKSKMYKKTKEKDKGRERDREAKEREKKTINGHQFTTVMSTPSVLCHQCHKAISPKEASLCTNCSAQVHKGCRENLLACAKTKAKQTVTDSASTAAVTLRQKSTTLPVRPRSAVLAPDDPLLVIAPRRPSSIMPVHTNLSKSVSISNIAGPVFDDMPLKGLRYLSQSTDSLHKTSKVNESTESLTDEEMMDSQLMGEFEADAKELEADSWSFTVDKRFLKQQKKDVVKRQDVIYELIQTEMHHVRTLKIMADVYGKGMQKEVQLEAETVNCMFPAMDELLDLHSQFFFRMLERKRQSQREGKDGGFVIRNIGDVLVTQFSGQNAERMKKVYGKFCSRHNEAVNFYKELHARDKRFQAFIKKKMSSTVVRRLGIPECILLVTQRITKYPVLLQRILQHTKESDEDHKDVEDALRLVKEVVAAVDGRVSEYEKKRRLKEIYARADSRSIMCMKSGQMFAREDLLRGRKLLHDGPLQLKNSAGRLKDVQALLLSDVLVFLQEKDQKYIFALLDQRSTVISLQKLIVRDVANEERGFFVITAGIARPEMVEVHASSKEERNTWMQLIQDAMHSMEKDIDEGIPSETEEDRRLLEIKAREMRDLLRKKDEQIVALLEEKVKIFRDICDVGGSPDNRPKSNMLFRAGGDEVPKGEPVMADALKEVETLQELVNSSVGGALGQQVSGPVSLPRRAETFGGFDSHQMSISKNGEKDEGEDPPDLRRTESDSVLKKGGDANLLMLLKRNSEQVLHSVARLHDLLNVLQAVVVQQDTVLEDQRQTLSGRALGSRASGRPSSLIEQEKQRSLEKQRQEAAELQRQQAAHAEERRKREREWEARERELAARQEQVRGQEEEVSRRGVEMEAARRELQEHKEEYQRDLERLRDSQRKLDREREQVQREVERMEQLRLDERKPRTPSSTSEDSLKFQSTSSLEKEPGECELSSSPRMSSLTQSKRKGKNLNPFALNAGPKAPSSESQNQIPNRLLQLAKAKDKKDKKKKKGKGQHSQAPESPPAQEPHADGEIFFC